MEQPWARCPVLSHIQTAIYAVQSDFHLVVDNVSLETVLIKEYRVPVCTWEFLRNVRGPKSLPSVQEWLNYCGYYWLCRPYNITKCSKPSLITIKNLLVKLGEANPMIVTVITQKDLGINIELMSSVALSRCTKRGYLRAYGVPPTNKHQQFVPG